MLYQSPAQGVLGSCCGAEVHFDPRPCSSHLHILFIIPFYVLISFYHLSTSSHLTKHLSCSGEAALATERRRSGGARILVLNVSSDLSMKYISFMNCVFSAQKLHVSIDGCCLAKKDSSFLQQAANITGGMYMKIPEEKQGGLLQYLLCMFLPDRLSRKHLILPSSQSIDFRPSCFCHHEKVDVGLVCSVCLSVFCGKEGYFNVCKTCDAKFSETAESKRKRFLL